MEERWQCSRAADAHLAAAAERGRPQDVCSAEAPDQQRPGVLLMFIAAQERRNALAALLLASPLPCAALHSMILGLP